MFTLLGRSMNSLHSVSEGQKRENIVDKKVGKKTIKQGEKVQVIFSVVGTDAVRNNLLGIELNSNENVNISDNFT